MISLFLFFEKGNLRLHQKYFGGGSLINHAPPNAPTHRTGCESAESPKNGAPGENRLHTAFLPVKPQTEGCTGVSRGLNRRRLLRLAVQHHISFELTLST